MSRVPKNYRNSYAQKLIKISFYHVSNIFVRFRNRKYEFHTFVVCLLYYWSAWNNILGLWKWYVWCEYILLYKIQQMFGHTFRNTVPFIYVECKHIYSLVMLDLIFDTFLLYWQHFSINEWNLKFPCIKSYMSRDLRIEKIEKKIEKKHVLT